MISLKFKLMEFGISLIGELVDYLILRPSRKGGGGGRLRSPPTLKDRHCPCSGVSFGLI